MKSLIFMFLLVVTFTDYSFSQSRFRLEIGAVIPRRDVPRRAAMIFTQASQTRPSIIKKIGKVEYELGFDKNTREIKYIHTSDKDFKTINGLAVGSEITFTKQDLILFPYWEIRTARTPDGWFPVIGLDLPMSGGEFIENLKDGERVTLRIEGFSKGDN